MALTGTLLLHSVVVQKLVSFLQANQAVALTQLQWRLLALALKRILMMPLQTSTQCLQTKQKIEQTSFYKKKERKKERPQIRLIFGLSPFNVCSLVRFYYYHYHLSFIFFNVIFSTCDVCCLSMLSMISMLLFTVANMFTTVCFS